MTTITTYNELKVNIEDYSKRADITSKLDTFIDLAEADIWDALRVREMEARATASTSTSDRFLALPDGFIKMRRFQITVDDVLYDLDYENPKSMQIIDSASTPCQYTITSQIEFDRVSDQAYTVEMQYFKELTALSSSNTTNDILTKYPLVYLAGCMFHFSQWALITDQAVYWKQVFEKQIAMVNRKSRQGRYGPSPSSKINGMVV
jgi:hypothetical protein